MDFLTFVIAVTPEILQCNFKFENGTASQIKYDINFLPATSRCVFHLGKKKNLVTLERGTAAGVSEPGVSVIRPQVHFET